MAQVRRPVVAVATLLVLALIQAVVDPTGLMALVGYSGARPSFSAGWWSFAPYLVFVPVMGAMAWWAALRAGDRFWLLAAGITQAVLLAQAATAAAMVGHLPVAGWAAGYVAAKAVPAAVITAAITRWLGGPRTLARHPAGRSLPPALAFGALATLLAGQWWTGAAYAPGLPVPRPERGILSVIVSVALLTFATALCLKPIRSRVGGLLGGWIAGLCAGGLFGLLQAVVSLVVDRGAGGDLWPLMMAYVAVADGLAFGACTGWLLGLAALATDRVDQAARSGRSAAPQLVAGALGVMALAASLIVPNVQGTAEIKKNLPEAGFLRAEGSHISDGRGNQVLLRGVNVNQLVDFYRPQPEVPSVRPLSEADFAGMAEQGFNVSRLNISWSALEPERGMLDAGYLAQIHQAVDWAKKHGIYTVLDMHQDGWWNGPTEPGTKCRPGTEEMWGYDGAPQWATLTDGAPRCQFTGRDISPAGNRAFQNFYFDTDGIRSALAQTWGKLAAEFNDEPMVAGFDLLNEPGFGETAPVTTSHLLGQFYAQSIENIRDAGARQIVFIEPSIFWSGLGFDSGPTPGFTDDTNIVFSPHLYAESITMDRDLGIPPIVGIERQFTLAQRVAAEYNAPLWSGEYGYWGSEEVHWGEDEDSLARLARYAAAEDEHVLGSAYWVWKQACGDPQNGIEPYGNALMMQDCATGGDLPPKHGLLKILSRAYPQSAPGQISSLNAEAARLQLAGRTESESCDLQVWFPGTAKPEIHSTGITNQTLARVPGGWKLNACASGDYSLSTADIQ